MLKRQDKFVPNMEGNLAHASRKYAAEQSSRAHNFAKLAKDWDKKHVTTDKKVSGR